MALLTVDNLSLAFGTHVLLDQTSFSLEHGERVSLIGRNGAGKTTLMRLILGQVQADDGKLHHQDGLTISCLEQEVPDHLSGSVFDIVASGAGEAQDLLTQYHHLILKIEQDSNEGNDKANEENLKQLEVVQEALEDVDGWTLMQKVEQVITRLVLDADSLIEELSGGLKRRVMLARALVNNPDILLLDEPTNHLDIESILWLEEFLQSYPGCVLFISHDRVFTQNVATRILELDRGYLYSWEGDYHNYLRRKEEQRHAQEMENQRFDKKLAQEEVWIRQGIKARRTRNEGRVRALKEMRNQRKARRQEVGKVNMSVDDNLRSGKLVAEVKNISYGYQSGAGKITLVKDFSSLIMRGDRIGLIGPNGIGKSTLLKLILGELKPDQGSVHTGTKLEVAWFDQLRSQLEPENSVLENIGQGKEFVTINGQPRHVYSYLQDFLFSAERARVKVKALSGGERNRLLLARLFTRPANLLVLDEPTNDLDSDTLDLLEALLLEYKGTLILVSHDREFLNNVVTSTLVFEQGQLNEYAGGYDDWLMQSKLQNKANIQAEKSKAQLTAKADKNAPLETPVVKKKKLSFNEKRELEQLPEQIEEYEQQQEDLETKISSADFYQQEQSEIQQTLAKLDKLQNKLEGMYSRWEELDNK
ncbi:MAG: ATP-binding cassette domain-containing protein [Pseudomonadota bacterium]